MSPTTGSADVFAKFVGKEIRSEMGRLLFSLLDVFDTSGYRIQLFDNLPRAELGKYGPLAYSLPHLRVADAVPRDTANMIYLFDQEDRAVGHRPWRKKVQVKFDVFAPYWFDDPVIMPYPVHPLHSGADLPARLARCRGTTRSMRIFFSGDSEGYVRNRIRYPAEKLTRAQIVDTIRARLGDRLIVVPDAAALSRVVASREAADRFVLAEPSGFRIDSAMWLETLAQADFFLCPPGYVMPMCHNTVEAMAVGAIPIINYPEWFQPALAHLENCIAFDGSDDLLAKLRLALSMEAAQIDAMRQRVVRYYENHLTAASFTQRIEANHRRKMIVLMITDANTVRNASKLNKRSVLVRAGRHPLLRGWSAALRRFGS